MPAKKTPETEPPVIVEELEEPEPEPEPEPETPRAENRSPNHRTAELEPDQLGAAIGKGIGAALLDLGLMRQENAPKPPENPPETPKSEHGDPGEPKREPYRRGLLSWFFDE